MKTKKKPEGSEKSERWLLTYSDLITLLLAFFIILYSMSNVDAQKYKALAQGMHAAFGTNSGSGTGGGSGSGTGVLANASAASSKSGANSGNGKSNIPDALDEIFNILNDYVKQNNLQNEIELKNTGTYVQIHLKDVVLFNPNSPKILDSSKPIMKEIEVALAKVYDRIDHITISGHTADVVVDPQHSDELSWQLSTERAVTVLNELIDYGLKENKLNVAGYAHYDPIAPNNTEEGMAKNRRVEITVFKNPTAGTGATGRDKTTMASSSTGSSATSSASASSSSTSSQPSSSSASASAPKG